MSSKPVKSAAADCPWSIGSRLVILITASGAGLLLLTMGIVHWMLARHIDLDDASFLRDKVRTLSGEILEELPGNEHMEKEVNLGRNPAEPLAYYARVMTEAGAVVAQTRGMAEQLPPKCFPIAQSGNAPVTEFRSPDGKWYLLMSQWAGDSAPGSRRWIIQVAQDRSDERAFLMQFRALLLGLLLCGSTAAAFIGKAVVRRGLQPLQEMTGAIGRIEASHLQTPISGAGWPRELTALAAAFDGMLLRLDEAFSRLSQFSADLAHELRTPLCNLRGEAEVALSRSRSAAEYREVLASNTEEFSRLSGMIDSLLFLARAENPEMRVLKLPLRGDREIASVLEFHDAAAQEQQVSLSLSGQALLNADAMLLRRAVSNLLANALANTAPGGRVEVLLSVDPDGAAVVSVRDTGCGIAAEHLPRLFDRFYRADPSRHSSGSGLGLAIVKSIADLHGGPVFLESSPGHGTTVTLKFPPETSKSP